MTEEILTTVDKIFKEELECADKIFLDYRVAVNIDARKIPMLEEKMTHVQNLMEQLQKITEENGNVQ